MGLQRAIVLARGGPPSEGARTLIEALPASMTDRHWSSVALFTPSGDAFEIDFLVLGHHALYLVEPKAYRGPIAEGGQGWIVTPPAMPDFSAELVPSPLDHARQKALLLAQFLKQEIGEARVRVEPVVVLTDANADIRQLPDELRSRILTPAELVRAVQFGDLPGEPVANDREPLDEATATAVQRILQGVRGRPRPGRGLLRDELPLVVRDIILDLRERSQQPEIHASVLVISCAFVRALEERGLLDRNLLAGEGVEDAERAFLASDPSRTVNDYLRHILDSVAVHPAGQAVLGEHHERLWSAPLSNADAREVLDFFRQRGPSGKLRWSFAGDPWTDLYQDISPTQRGEHGMLATPTFVGELMLDLTLTPALEELGLDAIQVMDPACGSGLLLEAAFGRLSDRMASRSLDGAALWALDRIHGADISPIAVLVTRIRLVLAYLERAGARRLSDVPRLPMHIVAADSLLAGEDSEDTGTEVPDVFTSRYPVVVTTPPVTCRDAARREKYRKLYRSAAARFSLSAPFIERCFQLATDGGFVGVFVANSFMKRHFGVQLVEEVLSAVELTRLIDTSGAYIPGHGTPTLLLVGRNRPPQSATVVRVLAAKRGEPITPAEPAKGEVWSAIVAHLDDVGYEDAYIAVAETPRARFARHPWSLGVGSEESVRATIEEHSAHRLRDLAGPPRVGSSSARDDVFILPAGAPARLGIEREVVHPYLSTESILDWSALPKRVAVAPYPPGGLDPLPQAPGAGWWRFLWTYRTLLQARRSMGENRRGPWWSWFSWRPVVAGSRPRILCRGVGSATHFALDEGHTAVGRPITSIEMPASTSVEDQLILLAYLNSSAVCFWMKQVSPSDCQPWWTTPTATASTILVATSATSLSRGRSSRQGRSGPSSPCLRCKRTGLRASGHPVRPSGCSPRGTGRRATRSSNR